MDTMNHTADNTTMNTMNHTADNTTMNTMNHTADNTTMNTMNHTADNTTMNTMNHTADNTTMNTMNHTADNTTMNTMNHTADNTTMNTMNHTADNTTMNTMNHTADNTTMNTTSTGFAAKMKKIITCIPSRFHNKLLTSATAIRNSEWYQAVQDPMVRAELLKQAEAWLAKHRSSHPVMKYLPEAIAALRRVLANEQGVTRKQLFMLAAIVLYTISPADVVSDFLPLVGLLDDLAVILVGLRAIAGKSQDAGEVPEPHECLKYQDMENAQNHHTAQV